MYIDTFVRAPTFFIREWGSVKVGMGSRYYVIVQPQSLKLIYYVSY